MRRISLLLVLLSASLVAAGCGEFGKRYEGGSERRNTSADGEERVSDEPFDEAARKADSCTEVEEFESEGNTHTEDENEQIDYEHNPPHSGDHFIVAEEWGLYDEQLRDEQVVHNLEHGHIVVTHKGLSAKEEDALYEQARRNPFHLVVYPRKDNPKDGVYYTAWTAQTYCKTPSAPALQHMIDEWRDQGPELFTDDPSKPGTHGGSSDEEA